MYYYLLGWSNWLRVRCVTSKNANKKLKSALSKYFLLCVDQNKLTHSELAILRSTWAIWGQCERLCVHAYIMKSRLLRECVRNIIPKYLTVFYNRWKIDWSGVCWISNRRNFHSNYVESGPRAYLMYSHTRTLKGTSLYAPKPRAST